MPPFSSVAVPSHCTNTIVCHGQPFTQMSLIQLEVGQHTCEAFEPAAQRVSVVALATDRVGAEKAVMDVGAIDLISSSHRWLLT